MQDFIHDIREKEKKSFILKEFARHNCKILLKVYRGAIGQKMEAE